MFRENWDILRLFDDIYQYIHSENERKRFDKGVELNEEI